MKLDLKFSRLLNCFKSIQTLCVRKANDIVHLLHTKKSFETLNIINGFLKTMNTKN